MDEGIVLDDYDKAAVLALLIRQVRAQDIAAEQEIIKAAAEEKLKDAKLRQALVREALRAFGFENREKLWEHVKEAISKESFDQAFRIARNAAPEVKQIEHKKEEGEELEKEDNFDEENISGDDETLKPKIRDLILQKLGDFKEGVSSAALRTYLEQEGVEMHEKTVGMTLYRLTKDNLVIRNGRLWSLAYNQGGTKASIASEPPI